MSDLFGFLSMADNYEERKVARHESDGLLVDTCAVSDSREPYETAIVALGYNDGKPIIVEMYGTKEAAVAGHERWVALMMSAPPDELVDISTADLAGFCDALAEDTGWRKYRRSMD